MPNLIFLNKVMHNWEPYKYFNIHIKHMYNSISEIMSLVQELCVKIYSVSMWVHVRMHNILNCNVKYPFVTIVHFYVHCLFRALVSFPNVIWNSWSEETSLATCQHWPIRSRQISSTQPEWWRHKFRNSYVIKI